MENATTDPLPSLHNSSLELLKLQLVGNSIGVPISVISLISSTLQLLLMCISKEIKEKKPTLVAMVALSDFTKSVVYLIYHSLRVYEASTDRDEVGTQFYCTAYSLGTLFATLYSFIAVFGLSFSRLIAICAPAWFSTNHIKFQQCVAIGLTLFCAVASFLSFVGVSPTKLFPVCNFLSITTPPYYYFLIDFQYVSIAMIVSVNVVLAVVLFRKWRKARQLGENMTVFRQLFEVEALKPICGVVCLCVLSFVAATILSSAIQDQPPETKAFYGPFVTVLHSMRGVFDFGLYLGFVRLYRREFKKMFGVKVKESAPVKKFDKGEGAGVRSITKAVSLSPAGA